MTEHDNADLLAARAAPRAGLGVAAVAFTIIGLAGPLMLAMGIDPSPYAWLIAPLWVVVIAGVLSWLRGFLRRLDAARAARDRDASPGGETHSDG